MGSRRSGPSPSFLHESTVVFTGRGRGGGDQAKVETATQGPLPCCQRVGTESPLVGMVQDSQHQALVCSWLDLDCGNFGNGWAEKSAMTADTSRWVATWRIGHSEFWMGQQRFAAAGSKPFKTKR